MRFTRVLSKRKQTFTNNTSHLRERKFGHVAMQKRRGHRQGVMRAELIQERVVSALCLHGCWSLRGRADFFTKRIYQRQCWRDCVRVAAKTTQRMR